MKEVIKQVFGDQEIDTKWDIVVERALRKIDEAKEDAKLEKLEIISKILLKLIELVSNKFGSNGHLIEIDELIKKLELKESDVIAPEIQE